MATLSDIGKRVRNTRHRLSQFFIMKSEGYYTQFRNVGRVMNGSFTSDPVTSSADQDGRESAHLFNITVSFALMQTSSEELSILDDLSTSYAFDEGHRIYVSGSKISEYLLNLSGDKTFGGEPDYRLLTSKNTSQNTGYDPDGIYFKNVLLKPSPNIDFSGEESMIGVEFTGRINPKQLVDLNNDSEKKGNWILLSGKKN